jgi:3-deoxy-D-manno-octulosonate 8-phosphate phosphatase (KDO 8-P phosphatase)
MRNYKEKLHKISTFIFDYDGVLSDGKVLLSDGGEQLRSVHAKDGYILQYAKKKNYKIGVISGGYSSSMKLRLEKLNLDYIHLQVPDKKDCFDKLIKEHNIDKEEVLYMGDDLPDFLVMQEVGLACCPIDAVPEIKEISHYISDRKGGDACVRDVVEQVMKVQGTWMNSDCYHW